MAFVKAGIVLPSQIAQAATSAGIVLRTAIWFQPAGTVGAVALAVRWATTQTRSPSRAPEGVGGFAELANPNPIKDSAIDDSYSLKILSAPLSQDRITSPPFGVNGKPVAVSIHATSR